MAKIENLGQYIVKKVIVEIKHTPNLLHSQRARDTFNNHVSEFDRVTIAGVEGSEKAYQLVSDVAYLNVTSEWNRLVMTMENVTSIDDAKMNIKKTLVPIAQGVGVKDIKRIGVRVLFMLPFAGDFAGLQSFFTDRFYKDMKLFEPFGKVDDVGIVLVTVTGEPYKTNLSLGPFTKDEVKTKVSEFKQYDDKFECALMVDIDLYQDIKTQYKIAQFVPDALDAARVRLVRFRENLLRG